jgi:putative heme-binding domain-containing protein
LDKTPEALLVAILDPNRAVEDRYLAYTARTGSGREFTGLIAAESANSLTLRSANGVEAVFLRSELESLEGTRRSLMPEGFEHSLEADEWPDLIAFLTASRPEPKSFAGNRPETVRPDPAGVLRLRASAAEIHGDSLVFEPTYGNLGYWQSANDTAVWTLDVPRGGEFEIWLDWARPGGAGDGPALMEVQVGELRLKLSVPPTGSWDVYRQERVGRIRLEGGTVRMSMRAVPPLSGAVLDLREVRLVPR